ncbi:DUF2778 domain-containing protein [Brenneria goodwinii]|uniref:DUF2778 domain-containing protein n=2 Tax=Brenneria goodwinii TaxID=1109412 RepID=UPI000BAF8E59|nr:DUF2778 domain-containing protein [Brenneria goodwinii]
MLNFTFTLNSKPMSELVCGAYRFQAFSGDGPYINKRNYSCMKDIGALPPGDYLIVDRPWGGPRSIVYGAAKLKFLWFALYRIDNSIDDYTWCNGVERGNFRLHPQVTVRGRSFGCITLPNNTHFMMLRSLLLSHGKSLYHGSNIETYGMLSVI